MNVQDSDSLVVSAHLVADGAPSVSSEILLVLAHLPETHGMVTGLTLSEVVQNVLLNARKPSMRQSYQHK